MVDSAFLKIQDYNLLSQKAYRSLKEAIVKGEIEVDSKFTLKEIAQQMGVSITPVREAINQLASEGLINIIPNKGFKINEISINDFQEILQIRGALEGLIIELVINKITNKDIESLIKIVKDMEIAVEKDDRLAYNEFDIKFHDFLLNITGNNKLRELYNSLVLQDLDNKFRLRTLKFSYRMKASLQEHKSIAYYLKERNIVEGIRESRKHIENILKSLKDDVKK